MVPISWANITYADQEAFATPRSYVKWIIDKAIEMGLLPIGENTTVTSSGIISFNGLTGDLEGNLVVTTDQIAEGLLNLYFTPDRVIDALVGQNISIFNNDVGFITLADLPPSSNLDRNIDGGVASSVYLSSQNYDGGHA